MNTLLYDLEITPILGWAYEKWDTNLIRVEEEPYIMSVSWKWLSDKKVSNYCMKDDVDDMHLTRKLRDLLDDADVVVAHNARKFDNRVASARMLMHGLDPPSPYKTVDTLTAARRYFRFPSNSLNDLCAMLGLGEKPKTTHASLWYDCISGDEKAWKKMVKYNNQDVVLLERLYLRLRPYITNHPNVSVSKEEGCPRCSSLHTEWRGYATTNLSTYHRFVCLDCGSWSRERIAEKYHPRLVSV